MSNTSKFSSEYNYSLYLPENWSEYETDEKNTNAFFDTTKWTGNLRITPLKYEIDDAENFLNKKLTEIQVPKFYWNNSVGIYYVEESPDDTLHYWHLIHKKRLYICSFTIGNINENEIDDEIHKVEEILKTIEST